MDHEQAIQSQASMRYALGELSPAERDAFEEHFADCSHCMREVESAAAFDANAREVFREQPEPKGRPRRLGWLLWRPAPTLAMSAALNLALAAGLGYTLLRSRPARTIESAAPQSVVVIAVRGVTRSAGLPEIRVSGPTVLTFDLPQHYDQYSYSIDRSGTPVLSGDVHGPAQGDTLNLELPSRLPSGQYRLTVFGAGADTREVLGSCLLQMQSR